MDSSQKKTSVVTFRLPDNLLEQLRREAVGERIPLNTLVNHVLERHVEWDAYAERIGMLSFGPGTYRALLESADERLLMEKGKLAGLRVRDFLMFKYKRANIETLVDLISSSKRELGLGEIEVSRQGSSVHLMLHHEFGRMHSVFFGSIADTAIQSVTGSKPKLQINDNSIIVEFTASPTPFSIP